MTVIPSVIKDTKLFIFFLVYIYIIIQDRHSKFYQPSKCSLRDKNYPLQEAISVLVFSVLPLSRHNFSTCQKGRDSQSLGV